MAIRAESVLRTAIVLATVLGACLTPSCSDDPSNTAIPPGELTASFVPLAPNPPSQSMTMQPGSASANVFSVRIQAKDVNDFFGTAFHVTFNPSTVQFLSLDSSTSFLNGTGINPSSFQAVLVAAGDLSVVATRFQNGGGTIPGVNVTTGDVVVLTFRALVATAGSTLNLGTPREVCGDQGPGCEAKTVVWNGGTMTAN
jgi:hypothetical protein